MQITGFDLAIIVAYMIMIASVGLLSQRKVKDTKDYYVAGRSLPTFVLIATICASVVGGSALIGNTIIGVVLNGIVCVTVSLATYKKYPSKIVTLD